MVVVIDKITIPLFMPKGTEAQRYKEICIDDREYFFFVPGELCACRTDLFSFRSESSCLYAYP